MRKIIIKLQETSFLFYLFRIVVDSEGPDDNDNVNRSSAVLLVYNSVKWG
jgi:hypothetical protein